MSDPGCDVQQGCITCGDTAAAMRVVTIDAASGLAVCEDSGGARSTVEVALVAPVAPGDALLVHAGTALTRAEVDAKVRA